MITSRRRRPAFTMLAIATVLLIAVSCATEIATVRAAARIVHPRTAQSKAAASNTALLTYKNDNLHTGQNPNETALTTSNVNTTQFGKRVSYPVDGQVYSQPLYVPNLTIGGNTHNVVFVTTEHDSVYAFDADQTSTGGPLWQTSFLINGATTVPYTDVSCTDTVPESGITGTPVIDSSTKTIYIVAFTKESGSLIYRLHALDITTGQEKAGSPTLIQGSVPGTGAGSANGQVPFVPLHERQRAALVWSNGTIYIAWASFCDNSPYHGWIMGYTYNGSTFQQVSIYNNTANAGLGGIWGSGGGIVADANGNIYYSSGNGNFDLDTGGSAAGDSLVKLNSQLQLEDYFAPFNQLCLANKDEDLGSGGPLLLPTSNELIEAGKEGRIYVLNRSNMGHYTTIANACTNANLNNVDKILQETPPGVTGGVFSTPAYWNGPNGEYVFFSSVNDVVKAFKLTNGLLSTTPTSHGSNKFIFSGGNPVVSSNGTTAGTGIVWAIDPAAILRAYDANDVSRELYDSSQNANRDGLDSFVKFTAPTVANGEVFVGTKTSLTIYGLLPTGTPIPSPSPSATSTSTPTPTPSPPPSSYNNIGISDDTAPAAANYDGSGYSYSAQTIQGAGINPGDNTFFNGMVFTWPNAASGSLDNYIAKGQTIIVNPLNNATTLGFLGSATNGPSSGTATITYTDSSTQTFTLGFSDWTLNGGHSTVSFSNGTLAKLPYRNGKNGRSNKATYLFYADVALQAGKTVKSVTLPSTVSKGKFHVFTIATKSAAVPPPPPGVDYNNVGISDDTNPTVGNFDGSGFSYSAQALQASNIIAGGSVISNGVTFTWPNVAPGAADNFQANGQTVQVAPVNNATVLAFLGSANNGPSSGVATITYNDSTTQSFTLGFSDWTLNGNTVAASFGNTTAAALLYRNGPAGKDNVNTYVFYADVALQSGKVVQSVTLPFTTDQGRMHVFAVGTKAGTPPPPPPPPPTGSYNNVGISDDSNLTSANYDGGGYSYSAQALQGAGITSGGSVVTNGVTFAWPNAASGVLDNYQASGQSIAITPVSGATTLAFLGSATNGPSSGTALITYSDGTTQSFTLGFSDWTLSANTTPTSFGNATVATLPYRNGSTGRDNISTYVFYAEVALQAGKTIQSVTLPSVVNQGRLHVFAVGTK